MLWSLLPVKTTGDIIDLLKLVLMQQLSNCMIWFFMEVKWKNQCPLHTLAGSSLMMSPRHFKMVALCLPEFVDLLRLNFSFIVMLLHWGFWSETSYLILKIYQILCPSSCLAWSTPCSLRLFSSKNICVSKRNGKLRPKNCGGQDYCCLLSAAATRCGCFLWGGKRAHTCNLHQWKLDGMQSITTRLLLWLSCCFAESVE